jgi:hypothetical protein
MAKTTPDELLLSPAYSVDETIRHNALAPAVADERWKVVAAATDNVERLYLRWHELTEAVVEARQNALASSAKAHAEGKNAPAGAAAKVLQAELEVDGCLEAFRAALVDARRRAGPMTPYGMTRHLSVSTERLWPLNSSSVVRPLYWHSPSWTET